MNSPQQPHEVRLRGLVRWGGSATDRYEHRAGSGAGRLQSTASASSRREMQGTESTKVDFVCSLQRIHSPGWMPETPIWVSATFGWIPATSSWISALPGSMSADACSFEGGGR